MPDIKIRWDKVARTNVNSPPAIEAFLDEYEALCRKHELCLSHEDGHGSFIIERLRNSQIKWVRNAALGMLRGIQRGEKMNNIYFTGKKVLIDGTTIHSSEDYARAVVKLGGEVCQNPENADLIIYGKNSEIAQDTNPGTLYPNAIVTWEGKIDDLVQELPNGIEELF